MTALYIPDAKAFPADVRMTDQMTDRNELEVLHASLTALRATIVAEPARAANAIATADERFRESARNLLHYLAFRRQDHRALQSDLARHGLSSLGRAESHVLATVEAVLRVVQRLLGAPETTDLPTTLDFAAGQQLLHEHTESLFGVASTGRSVRIMVTVPSEAATDSTIIFKLLERGMDCMRINCAHDDATSWRRMIDHLRDAERRLGRSCPVVMDLAGPKLRTGPIVPGPAVLKLRPARDAYGRVLTAARVWLTADQTVRSQVPPPREGEENACVLVSSSWLSRLSVGDRVCCVDARDRRRSLDVVEVTDGGCWLEARRTIYLMPGTVLRQRSAGPSETKHLRRRNATIAWVASRAMAIELQEQDELVVTRDLEPGRPAVRDTDGRVLAAAVIGCTMPDVFDDVQVGDPIWFDDGKIGATVETIAPACVGVRVTHVRAGGDWLRAAKGINLPLSALRLPALTRKDLEDLPFVAANADVVELSFANTAEDVQSLQRELERYGTRQPAIVLKIETQRGFANLPSMLLTAMRARRCGVMIARGDLAVECGFERLAEVQEEILWICEAAHVPVIWATQVLESLAKDGMPSRAEISDAAMSDRAECVMLNKGPNVLLAVTVLDDILRRMHGHQDKKRSMLRALSLAQSPVE
jgi:pyruvate kinase